MSMSSDLPAVVALALGLAVASAVVIDLAPPRAGGGRAVTTAPRAADARGLAARMEAQIAAGAPGVALAVELAAPIEERRGGGVAAARAHAQFELGDAPGALETVRMAIRICDVTAGCSGVDRAALGRLDLVIGAIVEAGVTDPKRSPARVDEALHGLIRGAAFVR